MKYGEALLWIVIIFLLYMNELRIDQLPGIGEGETGTKVEYMIRAFVKAGILFSGWYIHLPLFIVYLLIFCGYGMTFWSIGKRSRLNLFSG